MHEKISNVLIATAKGAVLILPGGGLLAEYIGLAQSSISDKRMNELAQNEKLYSCVQAATMGAMRAYQEEKIILLNLHYLKEEYRLLAH